MRIVLKFGKGNAKISLVTFALLFALASITAVIADDVTSSTASATSTVTVNKYVAIAKSANLTTEGINFGSANPGTSDVNATGNYNKTNFQSQIYIHIDSTTNVGVILCISDDATLGLVDGSANITNAGYTYSFNATNTTADTPLTPATTAITTSYVNISATESDAWMDATNNTMYFRFNLDVPSGQTAGAYSNNMLFKGVEQVTTC